MDRAGAGGDHTRPIFAVLTAVIVLGATRGHPRGGRDRGGDQPAAVPINPPTSSGKPLSPVFRQLVVTLTALADAIEVGDVETVNQALVRARDIDASVRRFNDALSLGHRIARLAPPRRRAQGQLELYAVAATQVDLAVRNTRVLARAARGLIRLGGPAPKPLVNAPAPIAL